MSQSNDASEEPTDGITKQRLELTVNDTDHELLVEPRLLLADVIRDELGFTGTKRGCETGTCGACTVLKQGDPIKSCSVMAIQAQGWDIETVESLPPDGSHPLQEAFIDNNSFQCGFCTPGILMRSKALLEDNPDPSTEEIKEALHGNICRCTGYIDIFEGIQEAAAQMSQGPSQKEE